MNHLVKIIAAAVLLAVGTMETRADHTNLVQELNIQLFGLTQGGSTSNGNVAITSVNMATVGTREVINALGAATGNTFSRAARLVVITPMAGGPSSFAVRDGSTSVDVSTFFTYQQQSDVLTSSVANLKTGRSSSSLYSLQRLALTDSYVSLNLHFDVSGIATSTTTSASPNVRNETEIDGSGAGDRNGNLLLLQGSIHIRGNTLEVVVDSPIWTT